jgi:hypothetical protein
MAGSAPPRNAPRNALKRQARLRFAFDLHAELQNVAQSPCTQALFRRSVRRQGFLLFASFSRGWGVAGLTPIPVSKTPPLLGIEGRSNPAVAARSACIAQVFIVHVVAGAIGVALVVAGERGSTAREAALPRSSNPRNKPEPRPRFSRNTRRNVSPDDELPLTG